MSFEILCNHDLFLKLCPSLLCFEYCFEIAVNCFCLNAVEVFLTVPEFSELTGYSGHMSDILSSKCLLLL